MLGNGQIVPYREKLDTYWKILPTAKFEQLRYNIHKDYLQSTWQPGAVSRKDEHTWQKIAMR
jgi:hypothetical protein